MSDSPASLTTHSVDTPSARIRFVTHGSPTGVPVLCLHGFPDSPAAYAPLARHLDLDKLQLIVPYLRGFGPTEVLQPDLIAGQEAALAQDILEFADAAGLRRFHLVGQDWGARAAYAACILAPSRIASLSALASPYLAYGGDNPPPEQVNAYWYQWFFQMELGRKVFSADPVAFCHQLWRSWSPDWKFSESDFKEAARSWTNPQFVEIVLHYYRTRWGGALSLPAYAAIQARLNASPKPKISVPTVFIHGGADACGLPASSEDQASAFTGPYERVLLDGLGHFPHREDPKAVAKLIARHIEKHA